MTTEEKRRLIDLKVGEISLVDNPANEEPFIVVKNQEKPMRIIPETQAPPASTTTVSKAAELEALSPGLVDAVLEQARFERKYDISNGRWAGVLDRKAVKKSMTPEMEGTGLLMMSNIMELHDCLYEQEKLLRGMLSMADAGMTNAAGVQKALDNTTSLLKVLKAAARANDLDALIKAAQDAVAALRAGGLVDPMRLNEILGLPSPHAAGDEFMAALGRSSTEARGTVLKTMVALERRLSTIEKSRGITKEPPEGDPPTGVKKGFWGGVL